MNQNYRTSLGLVTLIFIFFAASAVCYGQKNAPGPDNYVDLGNPEDEIFHDPRGWGGTSGLLPKGYGLDRTARYQRLQGSNSVKLFVSQTGVSYSLTFRAEAGLCDDSFEVYVNDNGPLYVYRNKESSSMKSFHQLTIDASLVADTTVKVTFRNIATDSCGSAAISFVALEPSTETDPVERQLPKAPKMTLQRALQLTENFIEEEKIEIKPYTLTEATLVPCDEKERCWKLRWEPLSESSKEFVEFTISSGGVVSYSLSR